MSVRARLLRIGDQVEFNMDPEARSWGRKGPADGTIGTVVGFYQTVDYVPRLNGLGREPGEYHKNGAVRVRWADGSGDYYGWTDLTMVDQAEYEARDKAYTELLQANREQVDHFLFDRDLEVRIRDLPDTQLWEGDIIYLPPSRNAWPDEALSRLVVESIDYRNIGQVAQNGSPMPIYRVTPVAENCGSTFIAEGEATLIARGNVWKYYHDEPLSFGSLKEELSFYKGLGKVHEVPNPATGLYAWTKEEVLEAIQTGVGHCFSAGSGGVIGHLTGNPNEMRHSVYVCEDEELGERARAATLEGFGPTDKTKT